ncbi:DUF924 domain-containing protein [Candidatus Binatia bacterium]|nr:DUF924 domain-containing protein [Candidatus Binatia bacterium]
MRRVRIVQDHDVTPGPSRDGADPERLRRFWFGDAAIDDAAAARRVATWFEASDAFDSACASRFSDWPDRARRGDFAAWAATPSGALALVLALDQLPRNLFRGTAHAFAYDDAAIETASAAVERGFDRALAPIEASFLYLPFEHAESVALQERSVALFEALQGRAPATLTDAFASFAGYARRHRDVIVRFGRFPHRNAALGRTSTTDEDAWLAEGSGF